MVRGSMAEILLIGLPVVLMYVYECGFHEPVCFLRKLCMCQHHRKATTTPCINTTGSPQQHHTLTPQEAHNSSTHQHHRKIRLKAKFIEKRKHEEFNLIYIPIGTLPLIVHLLIPYTGHEEQRVQI